MINTAVILAAGMGSRMKKSGSERPKGFIVINGITLIERSILILLENGISNIFIGTGHLSFFYERLAEKYPQIKCIKNFNYTNTGSFFTLFNMREEIKDDFLLLESDIIYEKRAIIEILKSNKKNVILASNITGYEDAVFIETDIFKNLVHMSKNRSQLDSIYGELTGISKISYDLFEKICLRRCTNNTEAKEINYEDSLINISREKPIFVYKIDDLVWAEIDTIEHLNYVEKFLYQRIKSSEQENNDYEL